MPIIALVALSGGLIAASLAHALLVESTNPMLPDVLVDVELALALVLASLPSLCFFASSAVPVPPVAISDKAPAQELMVVDPRRLGVLPDSMPESFQSSRSTTPVQEEAPPVDWRAGDGESERQLRRDVRSMSLGGGSAYGGLGELGEVRREEWEGIGDVEEGWGGK